MIPSIQDLDRRGIQYTIRTHLINPREEAKQLSGETESQIRRRLRNERWKELARMGWSRTRIAAQYRVQTATVTRVIGKHVKAVFGQPKQPVEINGRRYDSQEAALKHLKIAHLKLTRMLADGRARYVG